MVNNINFKITELAEKIKQNEKEIIEIYKNSGYFEAAKELVENLNNVANTEQIRVVFIGQYTAGKSTIISALTSNRSIEIDSDIATSITADYKWNGVTLTDTPGLYTENKEHDDITIDMIKKSNLLIYCITSDLFNQYTLHDFEKWAFEAGYAGKMFLVINKMSKEAGEYIDLVENYTESLNKSLVPHSMKEFPCSFFDAKDYKDGIDDSDRELIEYSHFEDFIIQLNAFIKQKGLLGKLDTPIMIMKSSINDMLQKVTNDDTSKAYNALLSRIEKKVDQQRNQVFIDARNIIRRGLKPISDKGYEISRKIGIEDVDFSEEDINELISKSCEDINAKLSVLCEQSIENLNKEIEGVLNSSTAEYFFNSVNSNYDGKKHIFERKETKFNRAQFESITGIIEGITGKTIGLSTQGGVASASFFIKASEASGSQMHKVVLEVGSKLGHKFRPWEAVKIAKNIGNVAKFAGPAISVLGLIFDLKETVDEQTKSKKIQAEQIKYRQEYIDIVDELENQYSKELDGIFNLYSNIASQITNSRLKIQKLIKTNDEMTDKLIKIKEELSNIQNDIF